MERHLVKRQEKQWHENECSKTTYSQTADHDIFIFSAAESYNIISYNNKINYVDLCTNRVKSSHLFQNFYKYKREDEVNGQIPPFK